MKDKPKMTRDTVPQNFTLPLALFDALPVLFFGLAAVLIGLRLSSGLFVAGALLCFWAGLAKVIWKIIVVTKRKNVWWLFLQMRTAMPAGFLLMLLSVLFGTGGVSLSAAAAAVTSLPSAVFFALAVLGMALMGVFGAKLDASDLRSNWIEQSVNAAAQACFFIGVLLLP